MPEIIPKRKRPAVTSTILLALSVIFLILVGGTYFVLDSFCQDKQVQKEELQVQASSLQKSTEEIIRQYQVFDKQRRIKDFQSLLQGHGYPLNLFKWLQENTYPQVTWTRVNVGFSDSKLTLAGEAEDFNTVAYQIYLFNQDSYTEEVELSSLSSGAEGKVNFNINLVLAPKLFKFNEF